MWHEVTSIASSVLRNIRQSGRQVFIAHVVYTGLGIIVLFPLLGLFGQLLLRLSGRPALSDQDILYFALTPLGAVSFIVLGGLLVFILAFEQASLMAIGIATQRGLGTNALQALRHSLTQAPRILSFALRLVVRLALLILPFVAVAAAVALWLLTEYDINFYLAERPPVFWAAASLIGAVLVTVLVVVVRKLLDWSMSLPWLLFTDASPRQCFPRSTEATRSIRGLLLTMLAVWGIGSLALSTSILSIVALIGSQLVPFAVGSIQSLVFVLGALVAVWASANLILTAFTSGSFAYLINHFFERVGPGIDTFDPGTADRHGGIVHRQPLTARQLVLSLAVAVGVAGAIGAWLLNGIQINDDVVVIAHRGAAGSAPENTLAAVRQAVKDGADWIEIDVQETADGAVVVMHDRDFMALAGVNLSIADGTLNQVQAIDVGSWFGPEFAEARVPTLAEVLTEVRDESRVIIELKYYGRNVQLEQRVIDIVEEAGMVDDVMIMSLSFEGISKVRALRPDWIIGLLAVQAAGNLARLDVDFLAVSSRIATPQLLRQASAASKPVFVWTINDPVTMSHMMSLGIDGIITDEPRMAREVLVDRSDLSSVERLLVHTAVSLGRGVPRRIYRDDSP